MSVSNRARRSLITLALCLANHVAMADVVAIVSAKNTTTALTAAQLLDIFLGRVSHFPNGTRVVAIDQPEDSAVRDQFYLKLADKSAAQMKAYWAKIIFTGRGQPPKEGAGGVEMRRRIAADPEAISYIDERFVDDTVRAVR
jgi:ABC-type phosphate transport system substrate-binding protein